MIKKNTKIIFVDDNTVEEGIGGMPLSKGDIVKINKEGSTTEYEVIQKETELIYKEEDKIVNTTYHLKKC